ncbi:EF-hand domain-containing family member B isoform X1 [Drosophila rhopaloa]|uniref:EF-hand domain-containing family member B isoform X1 n=1 Tax=Drosophila rhopaloa TaxID=1041015 RepID=A0A6P4F7Z3_DRORH|nr:EF-hand domain-containing family member B isoform X1 [Drosophila rhopaloa]
MANKGHFIERNGNQRAAGLPSFGPEKLTPKDCLIIANPAEKILSLIEGECRRQRAQPVGKPQPHLPDSKISEVLNSESQKTRFTVFKEKFLEDMYGKSGKTAEIMPTHSKPNDVTNLSRTFGRANPPSKSLYSTVMPDKSAEQVNREYGEFHRGHIVSNNHYFPSEQVNRRYTKPFVRSGTFGVLLGAEHSGSTMKKCLMQGEEHLTVVSKPWMDYVERTKGPLGKKYNKYLDKVPDLNFGERRRMDKCSIKMLLEDIRPCEQDDTLVTALSYLNRLRESLHKRNDFYMMDLIATLERIDKEHTGHMPLSQILHTMCRLHIRVDGAKIRTMLSHFRKIIDEGCATERVNYDHFCRLLSVQQPLPDVGLIGIIPDNMYNKETTYGSLCNDRMKNIPEALAFNWPNWSPHHRDEVDTHVKDILEPELATKMGVMPSDFICPRNKEQMERIFEKILSKDEFADIWQRLMVDNGNQDQEHMASVTQFRAEMLKKRVVSS